MGSQLDLDQGGTFRGWVRQYLGPTLGWVPTPIDSILPITAAGTYTLDPSTSVVSVNVAGLVTIILPSASPPSVPAVTLPGRFVTNPVVVLDQGGNAGSFPITIQPASGSENIMGLSQIQITVNYGAYTFAPVPSASGWRSISP